MREKRKETKRKKGSESTKKRGGNARGHEVSLVTAATEKIRHGRNYNFQQGMTGMDWGIPSTYPLSPALTIPTGHDGIFPSRFLPSLYSTLSLSEANMVKNGRPVSARLEWWKKSIRGLVSPNRLYSLRFVVVANTP